MPQIHEAAKRGVSHDVIMAWIAEKGIAISLSTMRKALYDYRRQEGLRVRQAESSARSLSQAPVETTAPAVTSALPSAEPDRLEQPVNRTPEPAPTTAQPMSVLADVLDPKRRASIADEFMNFHEQPRLGRKKAEQ